MSLPWDDMDRDSQARAVFRCARSGMTMDQIARALGTTRSRVQSTGNEYEIAIPSAQNTLWPKPDDPGFGADPDRWGLPASSQKYLSWKKATSGAREALAHRREA